MHLFNTRRILFLFLIFTAITALAGASLIRFADFIRTLGMDMQSEVRGFQETHGLAAITPASLAVFLLSLGLLPGLVIAGSFDIISSLTGDRSIRHVLTRCNRSELLAGRFLAHCFAYLTICLAVQLLTILFDSLVTPAPRLSEAFHALELGFMAWISILPQLSMITLFSTIAPGMRSSLILAGGFSLISMYLGASLGPAAVFTADAYSALISGFSGFSSQLHLLVFPVTIWLAITAFSLHRQDC